MRQSNAGLALLLFSALHACREAAPESGPAPSALHPPPARSSRSAPRAAPPPLDGGGVSGPAAHYARCALGFHPRAEPRVDVRRLGLSCGPANGMVRWMPPVSGVVGDRGTEGRHSIEIDAGRCVRLAVVAAPEVGDLEVEILEGDRPLASVSTEQRWALVPVDEPLCVGRRSRVDLVVRTHSGAGRYVVEGWRRR